MIENQDEIIELIREEIVKANKTSGFTERLLVDTPTDALEAVNKKYVDDNLAFSKILDTVKTSATSVSSVTVTSLNLNRDLRYRIYISAEVTVGGNMNLRFNGDGTGGNYSGTYSRNGGTASAVNTGLLVDSGSLSGGTNVIDLVIDIFQIPPGVGFSGQKLVRWFGCAGSNNSSIFHGEGMWNQTDNVTSIVFVDDGGSGANWTFFHYTVYKGNF